ncbi:hypothetical protein C8Q75DRAFT_747109 [Abortiporus biennis]|nr:hypothetical protein C8Q75DRAFT_747109 [Abortiporus biennis]
MQRRPGKGAHIAPPLGTPVNTDSEKHPSRLNQKTLGVTNRIWIILTLFIILVLFTKSILPTDNTTPRHRLIHSDLKPKNYLNITDGDTVPFPFCPALGPGDELATKYDPMTLAKTRFHQGSGARVQRVLSRALAGQPVTISVIGGSVSACHGAGDDPLSPTCWPSRFFNWWNEVFPHPASELTNGAMRRTNSAYFSFCNAHHVPDVTDLVIVELDVDDEADPSTMENFELLIRSLLLRPDQPAVVILGHFSPQIQNTYGFLGPDHWHSAVAQFYDVPHVSVKPLLYAKYMEDPEAVSNKYYADPVLANSAGHEVIADVLISYFETRICAAWAAATGTSSELLMSPGMPASFGTGENLKQPKDAKGLFGGVAQRVGAAGGPIFEPIKNFAAQKDNNQPAEQRQVENPTNPKQLYPHLRVPPTRMNARSSADSDEEVEPFCASANDLINPLPSSIFSGTGWSVFHPPPGSAELSSHAHYWYSTLPTSKLRIGIQVAAGDIGVYYLKEPRATVGVGSAVECWVDDNYQGAVVIENSHNIGESLPALELIDHHVASGSHYVECQLMGEEDDRNVVPFKIIGIFAT